MEAKRIRRTHGAELKAAVVDACRQPGASIAAVALEHGITRLKALPICVRLIRELHEKLMNNVRGHHATRGQYWRW